MWVLMICFNLNTMKKTFLCLFLLLCVSDFTFAQKIAFEAFACTAPAVSHWSLGLKVGPAYVSGLDANLGGSLDYSINPLIGFGLEGNYLYRLNAVQALGYGSLNLLNLCSTYRSGFWKRSNLFFVAGAGARLETVRTDVFAMAGLNAEYNLNKAFALEIGAEGFLGVGKSILTSIGLRYKFCSSSRQHARNIAMCDYIPRPETIVITETKGQDNSERINARIKAAEQVQSTLQQKAQKLADDLNALQIRK